jgi:cyclic pyranopterin phosphate synthase
MLQDSYQRTHDYLRVSVTDKCNLRCRYCMPPDGIELLPHDQVLRNEEFVRLIGLFVSMGVVKVRFTGGEPLVRKGFIDLLSETAQRFPGVELCLTTNGTLLGGHLDDLRRIGVRKLNISLDTLSPAAYSYITKRDILGDVIDGIDRALSSGQFIVKINAVLMEETLAALDGYLDFFSERDVTLRFIERMPFNEEGGCAFIPADVLVRELRARGELARNTEIDTSVAVMYDFLYRGRLPMRVGVIPAISKKFCSSCNRLRITSDGYFKTCLHGAQDHDLKGLMRGGADDGAIRDAIVKALSGKQGSHDLDCRPDGGGCAALARTRSMSKIGG